jgi:transcriptional regulator with XRE-family HTH domain
VTDEQFLGVLKRRIRAARLEAHVSQEAVADALNVGRRYYQKIEGNTKFNPTVTTLLAICQTLGVNLETLLRTPTSDELAALEDRPWLGRVRRKPKT